MIPRADVTVSFYWGIGCVVGMQIGKSVMGLGRKIRRGKI
jgi:hypothetical protein